MARNPFLSETENLIREKAAIHDRQALLLTLFQIQALVAARAVGGARKP